VAGLVVAALVGLAWVVSVSPLLDVDHLRVRGVHHLTAAQIETAGGVHPGDAMLWIDTGQAVRRIEALPYVRGAQVRREWPDTVAITVSERAPVAWVAGPSATELVDRTGRVLEAVDQAPAGLPQLLGATSVPPPGARVDALGGAKVAGALSGLARRGTASVAQTDHGVVLELVSGPEVRMGPPTQIGVKLRAALAVLAASEGTPVAYVDVSVPTNPVAG
jgi:cell division protein FtsQ